MSIVADIKREKHAYDSHVAQHKCGQLRKCPERARLWQKWMNAAKDWGTASDDDQRQREHYLRNIKRAAA
jgi:hypothetical protein